MSLHVWLLVHLTHLLCIVHVQKQLTLPNDFRFSELNRSEC